MNSPAQAAIVNTSMPVLEPHTPSLGKCTTPPFSGWLGSRWGRAGRASRKTTGSMEAENPAAVLNCGPVIFIYLFAPLAVDDHARFRTSISAWQIHLVVEDFGLFADLSRVGKWALVLKF